MNKTPSLFSEIKGDGHPLLIKEAVLDGNTSDDLKNLIAEDAKSRSLSRAEVAEKA